MSGGYYYQNQQRPDNSSYGVQNQYTYGNYGQQAPPPQYQTSTPQWQVQPGQPRPTWHHQAPTSSAPQSNYQATYNPGTYGPMSPLSPTQYQAQQSMDTTSWGVRYNQQQQQQSEQKPPLPPRNQNQSRPSPATSPSPSTPNWLGRYQQQDYNSSDQYSSWNQNSDQSQQNSRYTSNTQGQQWHPQYSTHPQTHNYEPSNQQQTHNDNYYEGDSSQYNQQHTDQNENYYNGDSSDYSYQQSGTAWYDSGQQGQEQQYDDHQAVSPLEQDNSQWHQGEGLRPQVSPPIAASSGSTRPPSVPPKPGVASLEGLDTSTGSYTSDQRPASNSSTQGWGARNDWRGQDQKTEPKTRQTPEPAPVSKPASTDNTAAFELPSVSSPSRNKAKGGQALDDRQPAHNQSLSHDWDDPSRQHSSSVDSGTPRPLDFKRSDAMGPGTFDKSRRVNSVSFESLGKLQRTGTIDGVIQAWQSDGPVMSESTRTKVQPPTLRGSEDAPGGPALTTIVVDPYSDLEPEYRASLARFAQMLRKESKAATDEEKFKIFCAFQSKETKLRAILYGLDEEQTNAINSSAKGALPSRVNDSTEGSKGEAQNAAQSLRKASDVAAMTASSEDPMSPKSVFVDPFSSRRANPPVPAFPLDTSVPKAANDGAEYSPGGRPVVKKPQQGGASRLNTAVQAAKIQSPAPAGSKAAFSPGENAPMVVNEYSPGANAPIVVEPGSEWTTSTLPIQAPSISTVPKADPPPRPVYTPFRYNESAQKTSDKLSLNRPASEAYSDLRRASVGAGRTMAQASMPARSESIPSPSTARREHEETFLGLIRQKSLSMQDANGSPSESGPQVDQSSDKPTVAGQDVIEELRHLLPQSPTDGRPENKRIQAAKQNMANVPDDFRFIREAVVTWDRGYKDTRVRLDVERRKRQEESEHHIDALFNDKEIGYSDISTLEEEHKQSEAQKQLEETRAELDSFIKQVFEPVTARLNAEISQLNNQYVLALDLLDRESVSGSRWMSDGADQPRLSQTMAFVLQLYEKIQMRYQKRFEALLERERRKRKIEVGSLYSSGYVQAMKTLEADFDLAEKRNHLEEAKEKDERANKLMDSFDRAIVRGLGENQSSIDAILAELKVISKAVRDGEQLPGDVHTPGGLRDLLTVAETTLNFLSNDSETVLRSFDKADHILNNADYDVSVAEARLANADSGTFRKLEAEKKKEDDKINGDTDARMVTILRVPNEALDSIKTIVAKIGDDPQHQERIKKALEDAKRRNQAKEQAA